MHRGKSHSVGGKKHAGEKKHNGVKYTKKRRVKIPGGEKTEGLTEHVKCIHEVKRILVRKA